MSKSNNILANKSRGIVNLSSFSEHESSPAECLKNATCWHLLFIYTMHALAHLETYENYDHAHYNTHMYVKDSPFYKMYFYGHK